MAFLLPENLASRSDVPFRLRGVARAFRHFTPDEVTVWLRETQAGPPYLVALDPACGIMVIDAPSLSARRRRRRRKGVFDSPDMPGVPQEIAEQLEVARQAGQVSRAVELSKIEDLPTAHVKFVADGPDLPDHRLFGADLELPILSGSDLTHEGLVPAIRRIFGGGRDCALSGQEEQRARAAINPHIILPDRSTEQLPLLGEPDLSSEDVIRAMDRDQERLAEHLNWGYRVIRGVAGSGKTLILISRARHLHRHWPHLRILLVTFNRVLASALEGWMAGGDLDSAERNLLVRNIDRLPSYVVETLPGEHLVNEAGFDARIKQATSLTERLDDSRRFDVVLVDEAQDFDHLRLDLCYKLLKSQRRDLSSKSHLLDSGGHFLRVYDSAQNVLRRRGATWNPPGVTAQGRTEVLRVNYRNTREILEFAMNFLAESHQWAHSPLDLDDPASLIPPESARRSWKRPHLMMCTSLRAEAEMIASRTAELIVRDVSPEDIVVMHGCADLEAELTRALDYRGVRYFLVRKDRDGAVNVRDRVRVSTLTKVKGLEFRHAFVCGANQVRVPDVAEDDQFAAAKSQLYAAMTRAMDELEIMVSGNGQIGAALRVAERLQRVG
ncbi:3'-5' exonuclease [Candidatus Poriferisodalis sp.]|uniref:3'-5' exonuclease n=1 Tax=Candidatus Poriferisodalis sp. TaxID=3101277 RepID=UPI003D0B83AE